MLRISVRLGDVVPAPEDLDDDGLAKQMQTSENAKPSSHQILNVLRRSKRCHGCMGFVNLLDRIPEKFYFLFFPFFFVRLLAFDLDLVSHFVPVELQNCDMTYALLQFFTSAPQLLCTSLLIIRSLLTRAGIGPPR